MKLAAASDAAVPQAEQSDVQGALERLLRHLGDCRRGGRRQCPLHKPDRLAGERRKAAGEAGAFEPPHDRGESLLILDSEIHAVVAERRVSGTQVGA